jgi:hypothetical protein
MYRTGVSLMGPDTARRDMRLFKENKIYAYAFCVYALNALFLLQHSVRKSTPTHKLPAFSVLVLQCICMLLIAVIAFAAIRKTSNAVEKTVLVLTGIICLLFLLNVISQLGFSWASFPFSHVVFVSISCAAALLAGWRALEVTTSFRRNSSVS